jgi:hypothetical protein
VHDDKETYEYWMNKNHGKQMCLDVVEVCG